MAARTKTSTSGCPSRTPRRTAPGSSTSRSSRRTGPASTAPAAPGSSSAPAPELEQGCCSYGAHFTGDDDRGNVEAKLALLDAERVAVPEEGRRSGAARSSSTRTARPSAGSSTAPASSSTGPTTPTAPAAPCTPPPCAGASRSSTGSPRCAGRCRCAGTTRPTSTATSPRRSGSGSAATGAPGGDEFHWWCTDEPRGLRRPPSRCGRPARRSSSP